MIVVGGSVSPHWKVEAYVRLCLCVCVCASVCVCACIRRVVGWGVVISLSGCSSMSVLLPERPSDPFL